MTSSNPKSKHQSGIPAPFTDPGHKPQVALVRGLSEGSFMGRYLMGAQAMAAELGIQLTTFNADDDPTTMGSLVKEAVQNGVDAIVINHGQTDILQPAVEAALEQGVPVVAFDSVIDHPDVPEIEQDDMLIGFKLAKKLVTDCAGRANVIYLNAKGFAPLEKRDRAWQDYKWRFPGLKELAHIGAVTQQTAADARDQLHPLLQEQPNTTAVLAMWDEFAKGAMQAITQTDLSHQIRLYSVDITNQDIQLMTEPDSPWVATVATDAYNIGRLALRTATALIAGEKVDKYLLVEPQLITQEFLINNRISNMDELIQVLPTLGESPLVWFDWMEPLLARNGYRIPAATLPPEQLLRQLQTTLTTLRWRNVELQAAAEVSRAASSILDPDELIQQAVDLIRERFDLYYTGLFLVDETKEWAVLRAGTGEAGRVQIEQGHKLQVGGDSMIGQCVADAQARIALDVGEEAVHFANPWLPDTRSEMALPLVSRDQAIGAMTIQSTQESAFSEEDISILRTMADQLANALQNARLFESVRRARKEQQQRSEELSTLFNMSQKLSSATISPQEIASTVARQLVETGELECSFSILQKDGDTLEILVDLYAEKDGTIQWPETENTFRLSDYPATARVMETQQPLVIQVNDPHADSAELAYMRQHDLETLVIVPLTVKGQAIGVMELESWVRRHYSEEQLDFITTLANQAATALENARLFEQTQQRTLQLEWLSMIESTLSQATDEEEILTALTMGVDLEQLTGHMWLQYVEADENDQPTTLQPVALWHDGIIQPDDPRLHRHQDVEKIPISEIWLKAPHETTFISDVRTDPRVDEQIRTYAAKQGFRAIALMPLSSGGRWQGLVTFLWPEPHTFSSDERFYLQQLLEPMAAKVTSRRAYLAQQAASQESERRAKEMTVLNELSQALTATLNVDQVLEQTYEGVSRLLDTTNFYIGLYDPDKHQVNFPINVTESQVDKEITTISADQGITGYILRERTGVLIKKDVSGWLEERGMENVGQTAASWLGVPLIVGDQVLGVMAIQSYTTSHVYDEQDQEMLTAIASQAAIALQNAHLYQESQIRAQREQLIREVNTQVSRSLDLEMVLKTTARELARVFEASHAVIHLTEQRDAGYLYQQGADSFTSAKEFQPPQPDAGTESTPPASLRVPITVREQEIGVLNLYDVTQSDPWSEQERKLASEIMEQAALMIENARLFEETSRYAHETATVQQITETINASENLSQDLGAIAQELRKLVPVDALTLATYQPGDTEFTLFALGAETDTEHFAQQGHRLPVQGTGPGWVISHREPWLDVDMRQQQRFAEDEQLLSNGLVSRVLLPLQMGDQIIGTLNLSSSRPNAFSRTNLPILAQVADQMALALERARLLKETQAALAEVEAAHRRYLHEQWEDMLAVTSHQTWGYEDSPQGLVATDEVWTPEIEQAITKRELSTVTAAADKGEKRDRSALAVPIQLRGQIIGVLDFYQEGQERIWTQEEKALVQTLAEQVALALENQRLFEQTQRRAYREQLTGEIVSKIRAAGDVQSILEAAAQELGQALGVSRALVRLNSPDGKRAVPTKQSDPGPHGAS